MGGGGGMLPQENLKFRCSEVASETTVVSLLVGMRMYSILGYFTPMGHSLFPPALCLHAMPYNLHAINSQSHGRIRK